MGSYKWAISPLVAVTIIVTLLITPLITTHEPLNTGTSPELVIQYNSGYLNYDPNYQVPRS